MEVSQSALGSTPFRCSSGDPDPVVAGLGGTRAGSGSASENTPHARGWRPKGSNGREIADHGGRVVVTRVNGGGSGAVRFRRTKATDPFIRVDSLAVSSRLGQNSNFLVYIVRRVVYASSIPDLVHDGVADPCASTRARSDPSPSAPAATACRSSASPSRPSASCVAPLSSRRHVARVDAERDDASGSKSAVRESTSHEDEPFRLAFPRPFIFRSNPGSADASSVEEALCAVGAHVASAGGLSKVFKLL